MLKFLAIPAALLVMAVPVQADDSVQQPKSPADSRFEIDGKMAEQLVEPQRAKAPRGPIPHVRYTYYSWWECDVDWNQVCDGQKTIEAPAGYQVCNLYYTVVTQNGHDTWYKALPASFYPNDAQSPDRFRAGDFRIHAQGNNNPFDHRGSKIRLENVGLDLIPAEYQNFDRYREGCFMPPHD